MMEHLLALQTWDCTMEHLLDPGKNEATTEMMQTQEDLTSLFGKWTARRVPYRSYRQDLLDMATERNRDPKEKEAYPEVLAPGLELA
jgi:hypothetical protein